MIHAILRARFMFILRLDIASGGVRLNWSGGTCGKAQLSRPLEGSFTVFLFAATDKDRQPAASFRHVEVVGNVKGEPVTASP